MLPCVCPEMKLRVVDVVGRIAKRRQSRLASRPPEEHSDRGIAVSSSSLMAADRESHRSAGIADPAQPKCPEKTSDRLPFSRWRPNAPRIAGGGSKEGLDLFGVQRAVESRAMMKSPVIIGLT